MNTETRGERIKISNTFSSNKKIMNMKNLYIFYCANLNRILSQILNITKSQSPIGRDEATEKIRNIYTKCINKKTPLVFLKLLPCDLQNDDIFYLTEQFGTIRNIANASKQELSRCLIDKDIIDQIYYCFHRDEEPIRPVVSKRVNKSSSLSEEAGMKDIISYHKEKKKIEDDDHELHWCDMTAADVEKYGDGVEFFKGLTGSEENVVFDPEDS